MNVQIKRLRSYATLPIYQTESSAAMDICAAIEQTITLGSLERVIVPSGFAIGLPDGYEAQIRARSGLSAKHGITLANGVGTIDADYRGEVGVILINLSKEDFIVEPGMRVAQMVIAKHEKIIWHEVNDLDETERGAGGFGSTGIHQ